jgi:hypothetical protein
MKKFIGFVFLPLSLSIAGLTSAQEIKEMQYPIKVQLQAEILEQALPVAVEVSGTKFISIHKNGSVISVVRDVAVAIISTNGPQSLPSEGVFSFATKCVSVDAAGRPGTFSSSGYYGKLSLDESGNLYGKMQSPLSNQLQSFDNRPAPKVLGLIGPDSMCRQELSITLDGVKLKNRTKNNTLEGNASLFVLSL